MVAWNTARESGCPAVLSPTSQGLLTNIRFSFQESRKFGGLLIYKKKKEKKCKKSPQTCGERVTVEDVQGGQEGPAVIRVRGIGCLLRLRNLQSWLISVGVVGAW